MFYDNFCFLCKKNNIKATPLLKSLGLSPGSLSNWKAGTVPNGATLKKIAEYFNVSVSDLLEEKEKPPGKAEGLSDRDREIIDLFSRLSERSKKLALAHIRLLEEQEIEDTE